MASPISSGRRTGATLALAAATVLIGSAPAGAGPAAPPIPRGSLVFVNDVLGPQDPGFFNPDVPGTRVLHSTRARGERAVHQRLRTDPRLLDTRHARLDLAAALPRIR
ncbi:hypothetical protein ACH47B_29160 [Rhodococcus sp. NPDC019627]|uniref:hypothetical protein n=1 Tax=unclassified Rhodococcus (in: high G+C Gram-positive bacteria) TaxID=192944 RepID=UPI0033ED5316